MRILFFALMWFTFSVCSAQDIVIWITAPVGGIAGKNALMLRQLLEQKTKRNVLINSAPGAGGLIGARRFMSHQDNNINLLINNEQAIIDTYLTGQLDINALNSLQPIANLGYNEYILQTNPVNSLNSIDDLLKSQKSHTMGSIGRNSVGYIIQLSLQKYLKNPLISVNYKGAAQTMQDLLGNHIDLYPTWAIDGIGFVQSGRLKPLAVSDKIKGMPKNVPTFVELALDMPQGTFFMVFVNPQIRPEDLSFVQDRKSTRLNSSH